MMTIPTIPKAPKTLDQIPDFGHFHLVTTRAISYVEHGAPLKHLSYVKALLQVVLKQESMTERRKTLVTKVNQKLKFILGPPKDVTSGMKVLLVNILVHYADHTTLTIEQVKQLQSFSTNVLLLDDMQTLAMFKKISGQLTNTKYMRGENVPVVTTSHMWFFQRNFLSKMAEPFFQHLFFSGIYAQWMNMFNLREEFRWLKYVVNNVQLTDLRDKSVLAYLIAEHRKKIIKMPEPISMADVRVFVYTYWVLFGICSLFFCVEHASCFWNKKVKVGFVEEALGKLNLELNQSQIVSILKNGPYRLYKNKHPSL